MTKEVSTKEITASTVGALNDKARKELQGLHMTPGVQAILCPELLAKVANFQDFTEDNDPYKEHDFFSLDYRGEKIFVKIDYYDQNLEYGLDPLDPKCRRVITVMLADEY